MNKINWINGQAGGTPLSAENLNLMQTYAENAINAVDTKLNGTVLFSSAAGSKDDTINFTGGTLSEGDFVEITFGRLRVGDGTLVLKTTGKIRYFAGMVVSMDMNYNAGGGMEPTAKRVVISSTGLTTENKNNDNLAIKEIRKFTY